MVDVSAKHIIDVLYSTVYFIITIINLLLVVTILDQGSSSLQPYYAM